MKQLIAIGGSFHGRLIEVGDQFSASDTVCFALTTEPLPVTPPKLEDLPESPVEAYRIGAIAFEPGRAIEYLIETRLSGDVALRMILADVLTLRDLRDRAAAELEVIAGKVMERLSVSSEGADGWSSEARTIDACWIAKRQGTA